MLTSGRFILRCDFTEDDGVATQRELRVLVATDGSRGAQAAVGTTLQFPWPAWTRVRAISARRTRAEYRRSILLSAIDRGADRAADSVRRALSRRWPDVDSEVLDKTPVEGILGEAERFQASDRGRLARAWRVRKIVVGFDGSPAARRVLAFVARLVPPRDGRVTLVTAVELMAVPSRRGVPGAAAVAREARQSDDGRGPSTKRFRRKSGKTIGRLIDRMKRLLEEQEATAVIEAAARAIPARLRRPAFAIVADLLLADGKIDARERTFLQRLAVNFNIRARVANQVIDAMLVKNQL